MKHEDVKTIEDLKKYIGEYRDVIYVREKINGKWGSHSLEKLPKELSDKHIDRFMTEGIIPVRLKRPNELNL